MSSHDRNRPRRGRPATLARAGAVSWESPALSPGTEHPEPLRDVEPAEPIAPWFGGKKYLAKRIVARIEAIPHRCYAEPFVGMGGVFLRRTKRPKVEVVNDLNGEIANLFRVVREHPDELVRQFSWTLASRQEFRRLHKLPPETLTDVQRAARFAYMQKTVFSGVPKTTGTRFSASTSFSLRRELMARNIRSAHRRLQDVQIECLDWQVFIGRYDRPFTMFYIDPPYWGHETDYGDDLFSRDDFARMAEILRGIKGRFILSLNDLPEVRETFAGFAFEEVETRYSANAKATRRVGELLISNSR